MKCTRNWDASGFDNAYYGYFRKQRDFVETYVNDTGMLDGVPDILVKYFDFDAYGEDLMTQFWEEDCYYFRSC